MVLASTNKSILNCESSLSMITWFLTTLFLIILILYFAKSYYYIGCGSKISPSPLSPDTQVENYEDGMLADSPKCVCYGLSSMRCVNNPIAQQIYYKKLLK